MNLFVFLVYSLVLKTNKLQSNFETKDKNKSGILFEISSTSARDIQKYSFYENEGEFVILPFTYFVVEDIQKKENNTLVKLKEIPTPSIQKKFSSGLMINHKITFLS